jgi:hypothetical protein
MPFIGKELSSIFWKRSFNVKDLVPDYTIVDWLKAIEDRYNLAIFYNENTGKVAMKMKESFAKATSYNDITSLCGADTPGEDLSLTGIKLSSTREDKDEDAVDDFYTVGKAEKTYNSQLSCLTSVVDIKHPAATDFKFRVFYYKGLISNGTFNYPSASTIAVNFQDSFTGIYEYFWKRWISYEINRKCLNVEINFELSDVKSFDWTVKRRFNGSDYFIKSMDFSLTNTGITKSKAVIYTMR